MSTQKFNHSKLLEWSLNKDHFTNSAVSAIAGKLKCCWLSSYNSPSPHPVLLNIKSSECLYVSWITFRTTGPYSVVFQC